MTTNTTREHCVDAETLAAWADAGLSVTDAARVELHLSNCERCQEVLAAFVRSEPVAATVLPFWSRPPVRWSAATLAAAAAVVLMVWTQRPASFPKQESTLASNESGAAVSADFRSVVSQPASPDSDVAQTVDELKKNATPAAEAPARTELERKAALPGARQTVLPSGQVAATGPPPPASPPPPAAVRAAPPPPAEPPTIPGGRVGGVVGGVAAGRAAAAEPTSELREAVAADKAVEEAAPIEILAPTSSTFAARRLDDPQAGAARSNAVTSGRGGGSVVPVRWRILEGNRVERSANGGVTWSPVEIEATATEPFFLTGGAAASQTVCWLVGRDGVVFLSKDGVTFQQIASPDSAAIKAVEAVDERHATITTIDGRKFTTSDAGQTWTRGTGVDLWKTPGDQSEA